MLSYLFAAALPVVALAASSAVDPTITPGPVIELFLGPTDDDSQIDASVIASQSGSMILNLGCPPPYDERSCGFPRDGLKFTFWNTTSFVASTTVTPEEMDGDIESGTESDDLSASQIYTYVLGCSAYPSVSNGIRGICTSSVGFSKGKGQQESIPVPARYSPVPVTVTGGASLLSGGVKATATSPSSGVARSTDSGVAGATDSGVAGSTDESGVAGATGSVSNSTIDGLGAGSALSVPTFLFAVPAVVMAVSVLMASV